jgi:hypothetical protein
MTEPAPSVALSACSATLAILTAASPACPAIAALATGRSSSVPRYRQPHEAKPYIRRDDHLRLVHTNTREKLIHVSFRIA